MLSFSLSDLASLATTYWHLQQKLEKASEDLTLLSETLKNYLNTEYLTELLLNCSQVMQDSKTMLGLYGELREERDILEEELKNRDLEMEKRIQDNQNLAACMEELKIQFDSQLMDIARKTVQTQKCIAMETKTHLEEFQQKAEKQLQRQLTFYRQTLSEKDKTIWELRKEIQIVTAESNLRRDEIELAEMAVQDLWMSKKESEICENSNNLWHTYSPSPNHSDSNLQLQSQPSVQLSKKRSSLMQDLIESHLQYQEPFSSKFHQSRQTIEELEEYKDGLVNISGPTSKRVTPTSAFSHQICINCSLKEMFQLSSVSISTQTQQETLPSKLYSWFRKRIIDARIKKR